MALPPSRAKSSYDDDLIDTYAQPYEPSRRHKSITLNTSASRQSLTTTEAEHPSDFKGVPVDFSRSDIYPPKPSQALPADGSWWRTALPDSLSCKIYLLTVLIETAVDLTIEGDLLIRIHEANEEDKSQSGLSTTSRKMPIYLTIFSLAHVWQFILAVDAVYARNTLQFIALAIFNALFLVYAIIQSTEVRLSLEGVTGSSGLSRIPVNVLLTALPIVIAVAELIYIGLGYKIYREFGWKVYKFLGADRNIKRMFAHYQIFQCFVKFDLFFWIGFCVQFIGLVLDKTDWEYYVTIIALPLSVVLVVEGYLAARYENKWMMISFLTGCGGGLIYFTYKFVKVLVLKRDPEFIDIYQSLTIFSVLSIMLLLITVTYAAIVWRNFGRGLKQQSTSSGALSPWL
ncbi:hypothetical protein PENSPDRAFT_660281 [Peniophora sp. CONT]|nr:hypothetical protein PENSPDRAFT_660281 [Peniophora sp. CONT]